MIYYLRRRRRKRIKRIKRIKRRKRRNNMGYNTNTVFNLTPTKSDKRGEASAYSGVGKVFSDFGKTLIDAEEKKENATSKRIEAESAKQYRVDEAESAKYKVVDDKIVYLDPEDIKKNNGQARVVGNFSADGKSKKPPKVLEVKAVETKHGNHGMMVTVEDPTSNTGFSNRYVPYQDDIKIHNYNKSKPKPGQQASIPIRADDDPEFYSFMKNKYRHLFTNGAMNEVVDSKETKSARAEYEKSKKIGDTKIQ
jgi:hypothetical protein